MSVCGSIPLHRKRRDWLIWMIKNFKKRVSGKGRGCYVRYNGLPEADNLGKAEELMHTYIGMHLYTYVGI